MPSMSDSHISCQAQPNINRQANTFHNMFAYTTIKFRNHYLHVLDEHELTCAFYSSTCTCTRIYIKIKCVHVYYIHVKVKVFSSTRTYMYM